MIRVGTAKSHVRFAGADKAPGQFQQMPLFHAIGDRRGRNAPELARPLEPYRDFDLGFHGAAPDASGFNFRFADGIDRGFVEQSEAGGLLKRDSGSMTFGSDFHIEEDHPFLTLPPGERRISGLGIVPICGARRGAGL